MPKIDVAQLTALADLAETLPEITKEIAEIEKSIGRLNALLGKQTTGKRRGRRRGKPGPKPEAVEKAAVKRKKPEKKRVGLKEKVLSAIGDKAMTTAELKKVDGRANAQFLKNMVGRGVLKQERGKYSKA